MTTTRVIAYALCLCDDGLHDQPDLLIWRTTVERAEAERCYYPHSTAHLRQRVLVESDYATDEPTDEPEAPVGEIPPALTMTVCTTCDPFYVAGITLRGGVPNVDRPGTSRPCGVCAGHGSIVTVAA